MQIVASAGTLEFVSSNLGLDLAKLPFGSNLINYSNAEKTGTGDDSYPADAKVDWYRMDATMAYEKQHPNAHLEYGFSEGKLAAVRLFIIGIDLTEKEKSAKAKASLDNIFSNFKKLEGKGWTRQDADLSVRYEPLCNPSENLAGRILITLPDFTKSQAESTGSTSTASMRALNRELSKIIQPLALPEDVIRGAGQN
jgi:hypothetical protein